MKNLSLTQEQFDALYTCVSYANLTGFADTYDEIDEEMYEASRIALEALKSVD